MGKKILDSKILYVVLSIILTVCFWCYVTSMDGTPQDYPIKNIPVSFTGLDILEDRSLMIVNQNLTGNITVRATPVVQAKLNSETVQLIVDVSSVTDEGTYSLVYRVKYPDNVGQVDTITTGGNGSVINVEVARFLRRDIRVEGSFQGNTAEGFLAGNEDDFLFSPGTISISGRADQVNQVSHALVTINEENLTDTISGEYPFQFIGANNNPLENLDVTCDVDRVYVIFPIRATAEIPLVVMCTPGGGLGENDVEIKLSTDSIMVAGSKDAVAAQVGAGSITLGEIDLASVRDGDELTFPVPLEDGLENLSGISEVKATVTVKKRVVSRVFAATHIQTINEPEGWNVEIVTKALSVEVRGTQKLMDELIEENILVVVDLQDVNLATGQHPVPARIALGSAGSKSEIGEMASNYSVVVTLSQIQVEAG